MLAAALELHEAGLARGGGGGAVLLAVAAGAGAERWGASPATVTLSIDLRFVSDEGELSTVHVFQQSPIWDDGEFKRIIRERRCVVAFPAHSFHIRTLESLVDPFYVTHSPTPNG